MLLKTMMIACSITCHRIRQSNISSMTTCLPEECGLNAKYSYKCETSLEKRKKTMTTVSPELSAYCPLDIGYTRVAFPLLCYKKHDGQSNWFQARALCGQEGGDVIVLNKKAKYSHIKKYMARVYSDWKNYRVWVGMKREGFHAKYTWFRGPGSRFGGKWSKGEPSFGKDNCVVLTNSGMADDQCLTFADTICEIQM